MSKNKKSLAKLIARDVLLQLHSDKISPKTGVFMSVYLINPNEDINNIVKRKCEVCAKGAIFVSLVERFGYKKQNEKLMIKHAASLSKYYVEPKYLQRYLHKYFDHVTLNHIEAAFELWSVDRQLEEQYDYGEIDYPDDLIGFHEIHDYVEPGPRMISIMVQIIMDDGEFNHRAYLNNVQEYGYEWYLKKVNDYV